MVKYTHGAFPNNNIAIELHTLWKLWQLQLQKIYRIKTKFCKYQESFALYVCAKFCYDQTDMRNDTTKEIKIEF